MWPLPEADMSKDKGTGRKPATNKDPVAGNDSVAATEDTRLVISAAQLLANDSDSDGDKLKITSVGAAFNCSVSIDCNGKIVVIPNSNFSGAATFSYTVSDGRGGFSTATVAVNVGAKADAATLTVTNAVGTADTAIALNVDASLTDTDGSETLKVVIGGVPAGATLNHGIHNADGTWTLTKAELAGLTITPPTHSDADFNLTVKAISTESSNGSTATTQQTLRVVVNAPAAPVLVVQDATGNEDTAIALNITVNGPDTTLVTIRGVPAGATLNHGTHNADGSWTLTKAQLAGLTVTPADDSDADFNLTVAVRGASSGGDHDDHHHDHRHGNEGLGNGEDAPPPGHSYNWNDGPGTSRGNPGSRGGRGHDDHDDDDHGHHGHHGHGHDHHGHGHDDDDDGHGTPVTQTLHVTVKAVADLPTLVVPAEVSGDSGTPIALNLASALTDNDGSETLSVRVSALPAGVTLSAGTLNADGSWTLLSDQLSGLQLVSATGTNADFTLTVEATSTEQRDSSQSTNTAYIDVHLGGNQAPVVDGETVSALEDTALSIPVASLLFNDRDVDGGTLSILTVQDAVHGTVSLESGDVVFTPAANYNGPASFTYTVSDGQGGTSTAMVNVNVAAVNDAPTNAAVTLAAIAEDSGARLITQAELLANAHDVDGPSLTATGLAIAGGNGTLVDNLNGTWTYTPALNDDMAVSFGYTVTDGSLSAAGSATLDITPVNDAATFTGEATASLTETNAALGTGGTLVATDPDSSNAFVVQSGAAGSNGYGQFSIDAAGAWTYTMNSAHDEFAQGQTYTDSITVATADGTTQLLTVTVTGSNDAPVVQSAPAYTATEDAALQTVNLVSWFSAQDVDFGDSVSVQSVSVMSGANLVPLVFTDSADGTITFAPSQFNFLAVGEDAVSRLLVTFQDENSATTTAQLTVDVRGINDAPVAQNGTVTTNENAGIQTVVLKTALGAIDADEHDTLSVSSISLASVVLKDAAGNLVTNPAVPPALSNLVFTQNLANGTISFDTNQFNALPEYFAGQFWTTEAKLDVTFTDGHSIVTRTLTVDVDGRNDAVVAQNGRYVVTEDDPFVSQLDIIASFRVIDPDFGDTVTIHSIARPSGGLQFTVNSDNTLSFDPNQYDSLSQGQQAATVINVTFTDTAGRLTTLPLTVEVDGINDAPVAQNDSYSVASGAALAVGGAGVLANDGDVDNPALYAVLTQGPAHGSLTLNLDGTFTYVANAGYEGVDGFIYRAFDNLAYSADTAVTITVTGVNFAADIGGVDTGSVQEDGTQTASGPLTISDLNPGENAFNAATYDGAWGSLALDAAGNWTYTLDNLVAQALGQNELVDDAITITSVDGTQHNIVVTVGGVNDAPVAGDDFINLSGNVASTMSIASLMANDSDIDGIDWADYVPGSITVAYDITPGDRGTVVEDGLGNLIYTPPDGFSGEAVFSYRIADQSGIEATGTVHLSVGVNHSPVVVDDYAQTQNGDTVNIAVLANDSDPDLGETLTLTVTGATGALHGDVVVNPDGTIDYTPFGDPGHDDSFQYTVVDSHNAASTGTVIIFNNAAPIANDDLNYQTAEDVRVGIDPFSLLVNDGDPNGDLPVIAGVAANSFNGGTVTFDGATIYYTPATDFNGTDSFEYTISDGYGGESTAFVYVDVLPVNDAPSPSAGLLNINEDEAGSGFLAATDPEGYTVHFALSVQAQYGTVVIEDDGSYTYTPNPNFSGTDRFWFTASDDNGGVATNYVDVQITALADVPYLIVPSSGPVAGDELLLSSGAPGAADSTPAVATFSNGEFISVWADVDNTTNSAQVMSQRFAADGSPIGAREVVAVATANEFNLDPSVLSLIDDSYVVTWTRHDLSGGGNATDVFAQRYDDGGVAVGGGAFQVNDDPGNALSEYRTSLARTDDGGFIVAWTALDDSTATGSIQARAYDAFGTAGSQFTIVSDSSSSAGVGNPSLASYGDGSYIAAWQVGYDIFARIFYADGGDKVTTFLVSGHTNDTQQYHTSVAVLENGDAVIVWDRSGGQNVTEDIVAQRIGGNGELIGDMFTVSTDQGLGEVDLNPVVVARPGGGFVVVYETLQNSNNAFDISAQLYGASGNRSGNEFTVSVDAVNGYDDLHAAAALTADAGFVVAWDSVDPANGSTNVTARVYSPGEGLSGQEDTPLALLPLFAALNDTDGSEVLSVTISGVPTGAVLNAGTDLHNGNWLFSTQAELDALLTLTFTAPLNESGNFTLTATAEARETSNNNVAPTTQSFSFIIAPVNDDPLASSGEFEVRSGVNLIGHLTATDVDDTILVYGIQSGVQHGQLDIDPNSGNFTYVSNAGYYGDDAFTFSVSDNHGGNVPTATVTLHVFPEPTLVGDAGDNALTGTAGNDVIAGGLGNDVLTGGGGTDVFVFGLGANDGQDTITDFDQATGVLAFKDVLASAASKVDAIDALIAGMADDGAVGTRVDFTNGASIDFTSIAFSGQLSIADLLHDTSAQLLVSHG